MVRCEYCGTENGITMYFGKVCKRCGELLCGASYINFLPQLTSDPQTKSSSEGCENMVEVKNKEGGWTFGACGDVGLCDECKQKQEKNDRKNRIPKKNKQIK